MVLRGLTIDRKPLKDHIEAVGHKEAFDFVRDLVKEQAPLSESMIKQIHYLVLADKREDRGVYRRVPVRIMGAKHEPAQPYLIRPKMEQLLEDYRNNTDMRKKEVLESLPITVFAIHGNHEQRPQTIKGYHTEKKVDRVEIMFGNFDMLCGGKK